MLMDPYAGFAERYDLSFGRFGEYATPEVEFYRLLFNQNDVRTVLDCACGTGRALPLFHSLGSKVTGSDVSGAMLKQARINLAEVKLDIPLFEADFRHLPDQVGQSFDAVVCLAAIGFMTCETEFMEAFESMQQVLRPGGILILSAIPTDRQWAEKPRFMLVANNPEFSRLFIIDYLESQARFDILDLFHSRENCDFKVWSATLTVLLKDEQEILLRKAGFQRVNFYGGYDFTPYDKSSSDLLITVAVR